MSKAVVLLSGGLDSAVTLAMALSAGYEVQPVCFDYKQRHSREVQSARKLVEHYQRIGAPVATPRLVSITGLDFPTSALTSDLQVPEGRDEARMAEDIPVTYVPARNSFFLSVAVGFAEALGAQAVFAGYNAVDYSGYPDCRPEFVAAMQAALALGTKCGVSGEPIAILAPIIDMTKIQIVQRGQELGVPFGLTWSCYAGGEKPCGKCDSCIIRAAAFKECGLVDEAA